MATKLNATFVYTQNEDDIIMIGFADDQFETKEYILLQRSTFITEEDEQLGQDNIHITYTEQNRSGYGGIQRITLSEVSLQIQLEEKLANELNTDNEIEIEFSQSEVDLRDLAKKIKLICGGFAVFENELLRR